MDKEAGRLSKALKTALSGIRKTGPGKRVQLMAENARAPLSKTLKFITNTPQGKKIHKGKAAARLLTLGPKVLPDVKGVGVDKYLKGALMAGTAAPVYNRYTSVKDQAIDHDSNMLDKSLQQLRQKNPEMAKYYQGMQTQNLYDSAKELSGLGDTELVASSLGANMSKGSESYKILKKHLDRVQQHVYRNAEKPGLPTWMKARWGVTSPIMNAAGTYAHGKDVDMSRMADVIQHPDALNFMLGGMSPEELQILGKDPVVNRLVNPYIQGKVRQGTNYISGLASRGAGMLNNLNLANTANNIKQDPKNTFKHINQAGQRSGQINDLGKTVTDVTKSIQDNPVYAADVSSAVPQSTWDAWDKDSWDYTSAKDRLKRSLSNQYKGF